MLKDGRWIEKFDSPGNGITYWWERKEERKKTEEKQKDKHSSKSRQSKRILIKQRLLVGTIIEYNHRVVKFCLVCWF